MLRKIKIILRKLFLNKEVLKEETIIEEPELIEELIEEEVEEPELIEELIEEEVEEPEEIFVEEEIIEEIKEETKPKQNQFDICIKNIEENRNELIKEKEEEEEKRKIKVYPFENKRDYAISVQEKLFELDKEGLEFFNEKFNQEGYDIIKKYSENGFYLARENKDTGVITFFHRLFMWGDIEDFCRENNETAENIVVHHKDLKTWNNARENLQVMTKEEHDKTHGRG